MKDAIPSMGAFESPEDYRTITTDMLDAESAMELPNSYEIDMSAYPLNEVYHQHKLGTCTACGASVAIEKFIGGGFQPHRAWLYLMDCLYVKKSFIEGSSASNVLKVAENWGAPSTTVGNKYPINVLGTYAEYLADFRNLAPDVSRRVDTERFPAQPGTDGCLPHTAL